MFSALLKLLMYNWCFKTNNRIGIFYLQRNLLKVNTTTRRTKDCPSDSARKAGFQWAVPLQNFI